MQYPSVQQCAPVPSTLTSPTPDAQITPLIADNIYKTAQLPGSNGSALRGNITIAGLLWAVSGGRAGRARRGEASGQWPQHGTDALVSLLLSISSPLCAPR